MSYGSKPIYGRSQYGNNNGKYGGVKPYNSLDNIVLKAYSKSNCCPQCGFKMGENIPQPNAYGLDHTPRTANNYGLAKVMAGYYAAKGKSSSGRGGGGK